jgi:hypothetical protein
MSLKKLVAAATDKTRFERIEDFVLFASAFLEFSGGGLQARIVSRNEPNYQFWQFKADGAYGVSRPINTALMFSPEEAFAALRGLPSLLGATREPGVDTRANRDIINRSLYTLQQCIGIALDALPAGKSNTARKLNGDLFERLIRLVLCRAGVPCTTGVVKVPVVVEGEETFEMSYQHDLVVKQGEVVKLIGSVKTSSKDRLDKVFIDKFLFNRLTSSQTPHVAIFLNDVQRKNTSDPRAYGVNSTFLPGHFKAYTAKLNPLDGVYYFDIRPGMRSAPVLREGPHPHVRPLLVWRRVAFPGCARNRRQGEVSPWAPMAEGSPVACRR